MKRRSLKAFTTISLIALFLCGNVGQENIINADGPIAAPADWEIVAAATEIDPTELSEATRTQLNVEKTNSVHAQACSTINNWKYYVEYNVKLNKKYVYLYCPDHLLIVKKVEETLFEQDKEISATELNRLIDFGSVNLNDSATETMAEIKKNGSDKYTFTVRGVTEYEDTNTQIKCSRLVGIVAEEVSTGKENPFAAEIILDGHTVGNETSVSSVDVNGVAYHVITKKCTICTADVEQSRHIAKMSNDTTYTYDTNYCCHKVHGTCTDTNCNKVVEYYENCIPAAAVRENVIEATYTSKGLYCSVVYCAYCNHEISRTIVEIPMLTGGGSSKNDDEPAAPVVEEVKAEVKQKEALQKEVNNVVKQLPTSSGAQVKEATSNTLTSLQNKLDNGKLTEAEYKECLDKIETIVETVAQVEKQKEEVSVGVEETQNSLPEEASLNLTSVVNDFYQKQISLLLNTKDGELDLSLSKETYEQAVEFIEDSVEKIQDAALMIKNCSNASFMEVINDYINTVTSKSFKDFDKEAADAQFVEAAYQAILINLQGQVSESLTATYNSAKASGQYSGNALNELEENYKEEMANVSDLESFEIMVTEVMRLKYISKLGEKVNNNEISNADYLNLVNNNAGDVETFMPIYKEIFKSWALNEENEYGMTLEELTKAALDTTKEDMIPAEYDGKISGSDKAIIIGFVGAAGAGSLAYALISLIKNRRMGLRV